VSQVRWQRGQSHGFDARWRSLELLRNSQAPQAEPSNELSFEDLASLGRSMGARRASVEPDSAVASRPGRCDQVAHLRLELRRRPSEPGRPAALLVALRPH